MKTAKARSTARTALPVVGLTALGFLSMLAFFAGRWFVNVYGRIGFDAILFTLRSSLNGVQSDLVLSFLRGALIPALIGTALVCLMLVFRPLERLIRRKWERIVSAALCLVLLGYAAVDVELVDYVRNLLTDSDLYEQEYADPSQTAISFPEEKRNLVYIILESMEISYLSEELGGGSEVNLIPELYDLALENTNFSHNDGVGGYHAASGATWTIGSLVSQTSGVPLKTPSGNQNDYGTDGSAFLPGITSIHNILADNGYTQAFMCGSDANFGGRKAYFTQHGVDSIYDVYTARKDGIIPSNYWVWWGMEDRYLFEYARQELTELAAQDEPFAFTMLTVDTHHIGGYQCDLCTGEYAETYEQSISCSSRQVLEFVRWLQTQDFYENTTVVIVGDHCSMDNGYFQRNVDESYERLVYNCFINSAVQTDNTHNREFAAVDLFPTTLAAMGCQIEGERLGFGTNLFSCVPTLSESMGYTRFNAQLAKSSDYYTEHFYTAK